MIKAPSPPPLEKSTNFLQWQNVVHFFNWELGHKSIVVARFNLMRYISQIIFRYIAKLYFRENVILVI